MPEINSKHLFLRPYEAADFPLIFQLQSNATVMRFIRPAAIDAAPVLERTQLWLKYAAENPGFGVWMIENIENQSFVGYSVLRHVDFQPDREIEVGYTLAQDSWGKGYATEATLAMMDYALRHFGIRDFVAYTDALNLASNRVLEKCGFSRIGTENIYGAECLKWGLHGFCSASE